MHNLLPQRLGGNLLLYLRVCSVNGELLCVWLAVDGSLHECVVNLDAHIGSRHLSFRHLGVDERLAVRMLDAYGEHKGSAASVLRHLASGVAVALHERHKAGGGQSRIIYRRALRANLRKIMTHAAATLHQLHLLFVQAHDGSVRVGVALNAYHEAVAQRCHLVVVADTGHRAAGGYDISEMVEQTEHFLLIHGVGVFALYASNLLSDAVMHVCGRHLKDVAEAILHGILAHPYTGGEFVTVEVFQRGLEGLVIRVCFLIFHYIYVDVFSLDRNVCKTTIIIPYIRIISYIF